MKKITFVIADLGAGGAQRVMSLLASALASNPNYHIDIVAISAPQDQSFFSFHKQVCIHYLSAQSASGTALSGILVNMKRILLLRRMIKELQPDVVVSFLTETNCVSLLASLFTNIPVIVSERSDPFVHPEVRLWRIMRRITYPLASCLVCQTAHALSFFSYIKCKRVIYNPVNIKPSAVLSKAPIDGPYILGVGRQSVEKGFDLLIEAHAYACREEPDLKLVLLGSGPERERLEVLAQELGTITHIIFAGPQVYVESYYRNALAFVLPSRFEGMPNALLEAMAYGCPVIVTPQFVAGAEIVEDGKSGIIPALATADTIGSAILTLYRDSSLRERLAINAQQSMSRFNAEAIVSAWEEAVYSVL